MAAIVIPLKTSSEISLSELFIGFGLKFSKMRDFIAGNSNNIDGYFNDFCHYLSISTTVK
jgi:hypothetical protein